MRSFLIVAGVGLLVVGVISYEVMLWNECRESGSFWYCVRVLSK